MWLAPEAKVAKTFGGVNGGDGMRGNIAGIVRIRTFAVVPSASPHSPKSDDLGYGFLG